LCDDALALLAAYGIRPEVVDIDADPQLRQRWNTCVPVVEIDGKVRFRGRISPVLLRRVLQAPAVFDVPSEPSTVRSP
jgi:hypothetical protein